MLTWVRLEQPQEQRCPVLPVYVVFQCLPVVMQCGLSINPFTALPVLPLQLFYVVVLLLLRFVDFGKNTAANVLLRFFHCHIKYDIYMQVESTLKRTVFRQ